MVEDVEAELGRGSVERGRDEVVVRIPTLQSLMRRWLPEEAVDHLRAARREQLLAMRAMVDNMIERIDRADQEKAETTRVEIPVE